MIGGWPGFRPRAPGLGHLEISGALPDTSKRKEHIFRGALADAIHHGQSPFGRSPKDQP